MTTPQTLAAGLQHHQAGRLAEAEECYRRILAAEPNHPDALHLLGVIALQLGQSDAARQLIQRALAVKPWEIQYQNNLGNVFLTTGQHAEAEAVFRRILLNAANYPEAHYNLGLALQRQDRTGEAAAAYRMALQLKANYPDAWSNLGDALVHLGQLEQASAAFRSALEFTPQSPELHYNLGNSLLDQSRWNEAIAAYHAALQLRPDYAEAHYNLGIAWHNQNEFEKAKDCYRAALALRPDYLAAQSNLGKALLDQRQVEPAMAAFQAALEIDPHHPATLYNFGNALLHQDRLPEAAEAYRLALQFKPDFPEAQINLGNVLQQRDEIDDAVAVHRELLAARPDYAAAHNNLGSAYKDLGRFDEALASYRRAMALQPDNAAYHSNLVYCLHFHPACDARAIREELAVWNARHVHPLRGSLRPHANVRDPARRLKIGYVSTDFRDHVIGRNLLPLFRQHDRTQFELVCYANQLGGDAITAEFRACADHWRQVLDVPEERLAEQIREDGVDVLVDLGLHMAHHRLLAFARQPAPVQVTFAGYPGSTGVETIRYRLTDPFLDPPGQNDSFYSEESIRLADSFWCFDPLDEGPAINALPASSEGRVTFGCLNNFCKTNEPVMALWARVLAEVADSRLLLLAPRGQCREGILAFLEARGVAAHRVQFVAKSPRSQYLQWHHRIDVILDTFPYNGHTTSLDALWMGVPVISLAGEHAVSRAGFGQMSNLDLTNLVAFSEDEYVKIATELARDLPRLAELRATLRGRLQASPLMDAPRFARNVERAYRSMWQRWCEGK